MRRYPAYKAAEDQARAANSGVWGQCAAICRRVGCEDPFHLETPASGMSFQMARRQVEAVRGGMLPLAHAFIPTLTRL